MEYSTIDETHVKALTKSADRCWEAILQKDLTAFADTFKDKVVAWKLAGVGGGGYMSFVRKEPLPNSIRIKIRRKGM